MFRFIHLQATHSKTFGNIFHISTTVDASHIFWHWSGTKRNAKFSKCNWNCNALFGWYIFVRCNCARIARTDGQSAWTRIQPFGGVHYTVKRLHWPTEQRIGYFDSWCIDTATSYRWTSSLARFDNNLILVTNLYHGIAAGEGK